MSQSLLEKQKQSLAKWPSISLRYAADIRNSNVDKKSYENGAPVKLCNYTDVYYNEKITSALSFMRATATQNELERFQLREGDVIITKDSESWDDIGVPACVDEPLPNVVCGYHLCLLRPKSEVLNGRYLLRALQSGGIREKLWLASRGVTRFGLGLDGIRDLQLPLPPLPTQKAIANFLDRKTAAIDALIEKKEKLLELLAEKRSALINQAVTKGLDPNVPMKDSGIPWIGEIPEHWVFLTMRRLCRLQQGLQIAREQRFFESAASRAPYITVKSINSCEQTEFVESSNARVHCSESDVLLARTGATGEVFTDLRGVFHNNFFKVVYDSHKVLKEYLVYYLTASSVKEHLLRVAGTTTIPDLNHGDFLSTCIPLPSLAEQKEIVETLNDFLEKDRRLHEKLRKQILTLVEYRQSLITAAVTGQLEIPIEPSARQDYEASPTEDRPS